MTSACFLAATAAGMALQLIGPCFHQQNQKFVLQQTLNFIDAIGLLWAIGHYGCYVELYSISVSGFAHEDLKCILSCMFVQAFKYHQWLFIMLVQYTCP